MIEAATSLLTLLMILVPRMTGLEGGSTATVWVLSSGTGISVAIVVLTGDVDTFYSLRLVVNAVD